MPLSHRFVCSLLMLATFACDAPAPSGSDAGIGPRRDGGTTAPIDAARPDRDGGAPTSSLPPEFFLRSNGGFYHYVRQSETRFADIRANIEAGYYADRGVSYIQVYCPYRASEDFRGVPAIDFFDVNEETGTVEDFRAMAEAADAHGIAVIAYVSVIFVDEANEIWQQAQRDHAEGIDSDAENTFLFEGDEGFDDPAETGGVEHSNLANADYATSWERPAINLGHPAGRAYVQSVLRFWIDLGVDGFEFDAPQSQWGGTLERLRMVYVEEPDAYAGRTLYSVAEGGFANPGDERNDLVGFTHHLLSPDVDDSSVGTEAIFFDLSFDELEEHFHTYLDLRRAVGRGAKSVSTYTDLTPEVRALEAALLAGNGAHMEIDVEEMYSQLDAESVRQYDQVMVALARSPAEAPGAERRRLPTASPDAHYAVLRTAGEVQAINVYNRDDAPAEVSVDLAGTGIADGTASRDLVRNAPGAAIAAGHLTVELPARGYGFYLLEP